MFSRKRVIGRLEASVYLLQLPYSVVEKVREWFTFVTTARSLRFGYVYDHFHLFKIPDANSLLVIKEIFDQKVYDLFYPHSNPTIVDIGSHIGLSILFFKDKFPRAKIHGFEPHPRTFAYLQHNLSLNTSGNDIQVSNEAVVEKSKKNLLYVKSAYSSRSSLFSNKTPRSLPTITVKTVKFSDVIKRFKKIDILKIDAEGMEHEFLPVLLKHHAKINTMFIEVHRFDNLTARYFEFFHKLSSQFEVFTASSIPLDYVEAIQHYHVESPRKNDPVLIFARNKRFRPAP